MRSIFRIGHIGSLLCLTALSLKAQVVWTGLYPLDNNFSSVGNWALFPPTGTDTGQFGPSVLWSTIEVNNNTPIQNLEFLSSRTANYIFSGAGGVARQMILNGGISVATGPTVIFDNTLNLSLPNGNHVFDVAGSTTFRVNGIMSGTGRFSKTGAGSLILSGANTYNSGSGNGTSLHQGSVTLDGGTINHGTAASVWVGENSGDDALLTLSNGGKVTNSNGEIGVGANAIGSVVVSDSGSQWNDTKLTIGNAGQGTLRIMNSGAVTATNDAWLGRAVNASGKISVESGASFTSQKLFVGEHGNGELNIIGGQVTTHNSASIGEYSESTSSRVVLSGSGSSWTIDGTLYVGNGGTGLLRVLGTSVVNVDSGAGTIRLNHSNGGSGTIQIGYDGANFVQGGLLNAAEIRSDNDTGELLFGTDATQANPYYFTKNGLSTGAAVLISGATHVTQKSGYNVLTGTSGYVKGTTISSGTLVAAANDALGSGSVDLTGGTLLVKGVSLGNAVVINGGRVTGEGFISTVSVNNGGTLAPGLPGAVGSMTINHVDFASGGTLEWHLQNPNSTPGVGWDFVDVPSAATLNITATSANRFTLKLISLDLLGNEGTAVGFVPGQTYSWTIFDADSIVGFDPSKFTLETSSFTANTGTGNFSLIQIGDELVLNFQAVPEPSTYALLALGLGGGALAAWRRKRRAR